MAPPVGKVLLTCVGSEPQYVSFPARALLHPSHSLSSLCMPGGPFSRWSRVGCSRGPSHPVQFQRADVHRPLGARPIQGCGHHSDQVQKPRGESVATDKAPRPFFFLARRRRSFDSRMASWAGPSAEPSLVCVRERGGSGLGQGSASWISGVLGFGEVQRRRNWRRQRCQLAMRGGGRDYFTPQSLIVRRPMRQSRCSELSDHSITSSSAQNAHPEHVKFPLIHLPTGAGFWLPGKLVPDLG